MAISEKKPNGDLVIFDPRFAAVNLPDVRDEIDRVRALEAEVEDLRRRIAKIKDLEYMEKLISFKCPATFKTVTVLSCKTRRKSHRCHCDWFRRWLREYVLDDDV